LRFLKLDQQAHNSHDRSSNWSCSNYCQNDYKRCWDAGLFVKADKNTPTSQLVQKIHKELKGVSDIYPIPTW